MNAVFGLGRFSLVFLAIVLLVVGIFPVSAAPSGQNLIQINSVTTPVYQGQDVTISGTAYQVSAQQLLVWIVTGNSAQVTGTAITFEGKYQFVENTTNLAPGTYGVVFEAPYNGKYPVTYNASSSSAQITTTGQPIYQFPGEPTSTDGITVANTIVSTCNNVGADINCASTSFTVLPIPTSPTPTTAIPTTTPPTTVPTTKKAPLSGILGIGAIGIGALFLVMRRN